MLCVEFYHLFLAYSTHETLAITSHVFDLQIISQLSACKRKLSGKPLAKENIQMCQFVRKRVCKNCRIYLLFIYSQFLFIYHVLSSSRRGRWQKDSLILVGKRWWQRSNVKSELLFFFLSPPDPPVLLKVARLSKYIQLYPKFPTWTTISNHHMIFINHHYVHVKSMPQNTQHTERNDSKKTHLAYLCPRCRHQP